LVKQAVNAALRKGVAFAVASGIGECYVKEISRVMCAVDFSGPSRAAFQHALAIAKARHAELNVVFAVPRNARFNSRARQRIALLADLRRAAARESVHMTISVQQGDPASVILLHANSSNSPSLPDLIVLGTHGRTGLDRLRLGSVAERVLQLAPCPTLIVRASEPRPENPPVGRFQRILCAIDFLPASLSALDRAIRTRRESGGALRLLHVVSWARSVPRLAWQFAGHDFTEELTSTAWWRLRKLLSSSKDVNERVDIQVRVGPVGHAIARAASNMCADLVVIGVTPRSRVARLFGSTVARLVRAVDCPVLAVPQLMRAHVTTGDDQVNAPVAA
jgi:nucleotide-binding universal stress UspA family protein